MSSTHRFPDFSKPVLVDPREMPTHPEMPAVRAVRNSRAKTLDLFPSGERFVIEAICHADQVDPAQLSKLRSGFNGNRITFAEYRCQTTGIAYVYFGPGVDQELKHLGIQSDGTEVLLGVESLGEARVLKKWPERE